MADYPGAISLSQAHSSSDDSSDHSVPALSTPGTASASSSKPRTTTSSKTNKIPSIDHRQLMIQSPLPDQSATRKPRGRPPGSKNKPKPPIVITKDSDSAMKPVVLEISAGADVIDNIISFSRANRAGVTIISATGAVSQVTLRQPISHAHSLSLHGPFHLLSLSGSFFAGSSNGSSSSSSSSSFGVTLAGAQGQVFGGIVAGKVTAASQVVVVAATFSNPSVHSLPVSEESDQQHHHNHHHDHRQQQPQESEHSIGVVGGSGASESCSSAGKSMSVYGAANPTHLNCQISPDVMHWAPSSRPPY